MLTHAWWMLPSLSCHRCIAMCGIAIALAIAIIVVAALSASISIALTVMVDVAARHAVAIDAATIIASPPWP